MYTLDICEICKSNITYKYNQEGQYACCNQENGSAELVIAQINGMK